MKLKSVFVCQNCSASFSTWSGQCSKCGEWNTLVETLDTRVDIKTKGISGKRTTDTEVKSLAGVKADSLQRVNTGINEFNRVLGGGFVPGQVVLLAGEPGVGKSTLVTQVCKKLDSSRILYVCGEENPGQLKLRALRMGYDGANLFTTSETGVSAIEQIVYSNTGRAKFDFLIVDSIQTLYTPELMSSVGSIAQIRECTQRIVRFSKSMNMCTILIGHITKEGEIAGPKVLEHVVDTVLYMEGDNQHLYRILRTTKNRFGAVSEVGIFEMTEDGIREVENPSSMFISKAQGDLIGSSVAVAMEGFRALTYEVQALAVRTSFGYPKRTSIGFNVNRLQVLLAVLEKKCNIACSQFDIYLNIAGGFKVSDPALDLAVCVSVASAVLAKPVMSKSCFFGEVGLLGEIRAVPHAVKREKESTRLGYKPQSSIKTLKDAIGKYLVN